MQFLSSKIVHELQTAFRYILDSQKVKQGEMRLEKLKKQENFELALATFISRSQAYHQRLLALLQLQKRLIITDQQTAWSLKQVYFRDSDKIAQKICKLITSIENIKLASEFIKVDKSQEGSSIYRQIEIIFNLLRYQDKAVIAIQHHQELLYNYFIDVIQILQCQEQCFFVIVCLALFYYHCLKIPLKEEKLINHWYQIEAKCYLFQENQTSLIVEIIKKLLFKTSINFKPYSFAKLLKTIFQSIFRSNQIKLQFLSQSLEIVLKNYEILSQIELRQEFIEAIKCHNANRIDIMMSNLKIYGNIEIQFDNSLEIQNKNQALVKQLCCKQIENIFSNHYEWLIHQHLPTFRNSIEALETILSLINYYGSAQFAPINEAASSLLMKAFEQLKHQQFSINYQRAHQGYITQCVTIIQFLGRFKSYIEICMLPDFVNVVMQKGKIYENLSPFCDSFLNQIWKQLTYMQTEDLINFIEIHLSQINNNQWTVRFQSYESFFHLLLYLEESSKYFSTCTLNDSLLQCFVKSHQIICQILRQNSSAKMNFELFQKVLSLTSFIIENKALKYDNNVINKLNIPFLVQKIQEYLLLSEVSAIIVAFHRYKSNQILDCIKNDSERWLIDELDYKYRIQLYLKQIEYAAQFPFFSQVQILQKNLGANIINFLKSLSNSQLNQFRQTNLWEQLMKIYNIKAELNPKMEIQFS